MTLDVDSPRPVRPLKRSFEDIDPDCAPPNKHARLFSPTSFLIIPPTYDRLSEVPRPSSLPSNNTSSAPFYQEFVRPPIQGFVDCGSDCPPASKRHRLLSPTSLPTYDGPSLAQAALHRNQRLYDLSKDFLTNTILVVRIRAIAIAYIRQLFCQLHRTLTSGSPKSREQAVPQAVAQGVLRRSFPAVNRSRSLTSLHIRPYR